MVRAAAAAILAVSLLLAPAAAASKRSEARRYAAAIRDYEKAERKAVGAVAPDYHARRDRGNTDGYDSLLADDPVLRTMEDAVNQP